MRILMILALLMFIGGCGDNDAKTTGSTKEGDEEVIELVGEQPYFPYNQRISRSNAEETLAELTDNPVFPEVITEIVQTMPSINRVGTADARVQVSVQDPDCTPLNSEEHTVRDVIVKRPYPPSPFRRHNTKRWVLYDENGDQFSYSHVVASWHNEIPGDDVVRGYWVCSDSADGGIKIGKFVNGREFEGTPKLPTTGKAIYTGYITGLHTYYYGSDWIQVDPLVTEGIKEIGEFIAPAVLEVDFEKRTIRGCMGCAENLETSGLGLDAQNNPAPPVGPLYTDLSFNSTALLATPIGQDGSFEGVNSKFKLDNPALDFFLAATVGDSVWDGKFSTIPAEDKLGPRGIAGSTWGEIRYEDGSFSKFIATYTASKLILEF